MLTDELAQLGSEIKFPAECQVCLDPPFERDQPDLLEALDRRLREVVVGKVGERAAPPQPESVAQQLGRLGRLRVVGARDRPLEQSEIELARLRRGACTPEPRVTIRSLPSALRKPAMRTCSDLRALAGGLSPQSSSISRSAETASFACSSR